MESKVALQSMSTEHRDGRRARYPSPQLVDEAADALERRVFFEELSGRYEALRADPDAWSEIEAERTAESGALLDRSS